MLISAVVVFVLALIGLGVASLVTTRSVGAPFGLSARAGEMIATLIRTQEPYVPRLHRNPDRDRFRIDLRLTPIAGDARPRMINLARDLDRAAFHPGTKILGTDGPLLWMFVPELKAVDLRTGRVAAMKDLRAANPEIGEIWITARFHFTDRLHLMTPDRQRSYTIDPDTLRARRDDAVPRINWQAPTMAPETLLCLGGQVTPTDWFGMLAPTERDTSFRMGSLLAQDQPAQRSREPRSLYQLRLDPAGTRHRIASVNALSEQSFVDGALIRSAPGAGPLRLADPDGLLLTYRIGSVLSPTVGVARVDLQGRTIWTLDTGLRALEQVLPHVQSPILVGHLPAPEGNVPEPVLVIIQVATGAATTRSLRP